MVIRGAQQEICFSESLKRICTISTGIPNLGVWCKKWSNWTSAVGQKNPTPAPSVVRNPTSHFPQNLRLLATPQLCADVRVFTSSLFVMIPLVAPTYNAPTLSKLKFTIGLQTFYSVRIIHCVLPINDSNSSSHKHAGSQAPLQPGPVSIYFHYWD